MSDLVTVAIPTYNRKEMLFECIHSVLKQDYKNIEILISDNASDDGTYELIKNIKNKYYYKIINYHKFNENMGAYANWKYCVDNAAGKYIIILSDDDLLMDDAITNLVSGMNDDISLVIGHVKYVDNNMNEKVACINKSGEYTFAEFWNSRFKFLCQDTPSATLHKTDLYRECFELYEKTGSSMDVAVDMHMAKNGKVKMIDKYVTVYRIHEGNDSNNILRCASSQIGFYEKMITLAEDVEQRMVLTDFCIRIVYSYSVMAIKKIDIYDFIKCLKIIKNNWCNNNVIFCKKILYLCIGSILSKIGISK